MSSLFSSTKIHTLVRLRRRLLFHVANLLVIRKKVTFKKIENFALSIISKNVLQIFNDDHLFSWKNRLKLDVESTITF